MDRRKRVVVLRVNGEVHERLVRSADTLLDVLRGGLGLTGTRRGCDLGTCGCCTVQVDGRPRLACLTLAAEVEGSEIRTVEGLARDGRLAPLQQCWIEAGASQCGFCSPGFLLAADRLVREEPEAGRERIREALAGNLCRCTGFVKILDAVEACLERARAGRREESPA